MITKEVLTSTKGDTLTVTLKIDRSIDLRWIRKVLLDNKVPATNLNVDTMVAYICDALSEEPNLHATQDLVKSVFKLNIEHLPHLSWSAYFTEVEVTVDIKVTDNISIIPSCAIQKSKDVSVSVQGEGVTDTIHTNYIKIANYYNIGAFHNLESATPYFFQYACDYLENRVNDGKKYAPPC